MSSTSENVKKATPLIAAVLLLAAVALAWSGSIVAPFQFDDVPSIVDNATIRNLGSFDWLRPPATAGETVSGRPVLNFTFAVNYALSGLDVRGYRIANILIHCLAALLLFGIVRRTLASFHDRSPLAEGPERSRRAGDSEPSLGSVHLERDTNFIALSVALLWALHPLHTGAVTYVVQRAESLSGMLVLLTLYCFVRGVGRVSDPPPATKRQFTDLPYLWNRSRLWFTASVASCLLAIGTKEVAATAPLVVLLYDRAFVCGSFAGTLRARWRMHAALASTWLILVVLVISNRGRGGSAGFATEIDSWSYLLTQAGAIVHYLALAFWPVGLVFDHGIPTVAGLAEVLPQFLIVVMLGAAAAWGLIRNEASGFLGASFFLLLAPSSSLVPIATQTVAEHRMYLPLTALIVLVCMCVYRGLQKFELPTVVGAVLAAVAAMALGAATFARNQVFRSELSLWQDTAEKRPENPRARNNLGMALSAAGRTDEAVAEFEQAISLQPNHAFAHFNLAVLRASREEWGAAIEHFRAAVAADPGYVSAHVNLGDSLAHLGKMDEAFAHYREALALDPGANDARTSLAALLIRQDRAAEAVTMLRSVIAVAPEHALAHFHLGRAIEHAGGSSAEAAAAYQAAIRLEPGMAAAHFALGNVLAARGDTAGAERSVREALRLDANLAGARFALGNILAGQRLFDLAMNEYREALRLEPGHVDALANLGNCLLVTRRFREAAATYEQVLRLRPGDAAVKENLRLALELERSGAPR